MKIDQQVVEESLEDEDCKDIGKSDYSRDSEDNWYYESESDTTEVVFYRWKTIDKKITKSRIEVSFEDAIEMLKEEIAILKEHIHIKRRQVNVYQEMKTSLSSNNLMIQVDFAESKLTLQRVTTMSNRMSFKVPILVINVSAFLQGLAI